MGALQRILTGELLNKKLIQCLPNTGLIIVSGGIGGGKSALSYAILEFLHFNNPQTSIFVYGFPEQAIYLLPNWIKLLEKIEFPESSIILVDEAYISFYSRDSQSNINKWIDKFTGLIRQKNILGIFISQTLRKLELGILSSSQSLLIKEVPYMQVTLDRSPLRTKLKQVMNEYQKVASQGYNPQKCVYIISNKAYFEGMITNANGLPTFWNEKLSKPWAGIDLN